MENVRYGTATTTRKNKGPSYERTSAAIVNAAAAAASSRQTPSTGGGYENYHSGRRQWSRRRDVHPSPDDVVRVSTLSPPAAAAQADAVRRRVDSSDVHTAKSSAPFWSPTAASTTGVGQTTAARSRSRPRPQFILEHAAVGRGQMSSGGDYVRDSAANRRVREDQQFTDEYRRQHRGHRQQQQQQQHQAAAGLNLSVEISARCAVDYRPQVGHNSSLLPRPTVTSPLPTPAAPVSPSYLHDNKTLLKEAIISAAAAKLARSSSARSAVVRPLVVVRNGPFKASSDEHVDGSDEAAVPCPLNSDGAASPVTPESCMEHTADVAVAAAAAAAARRSRSRRQDANSSVVAPAPGTSAQNDTETRKTRPVVYGVTAGDQASQSSAAASSVSGTSMQGSAGSPETRTAYNDSSRSTAAQTSTSSNRDRRQLSVISATDTTYGSETLSKTKKTGVNAGNIGKCSQTSASNTPRTDTQRANRTINDSNVNDRTNTSNVGAGESHQESPSSGSKVSFIKSILTRTRSPSPSRRRRSRSRGLQASPSSSSVRRLGAEVAQRISEPVKGYLKQLRDRSSSQRRRPTDEPALAVDNNNTKTGCQPPPPSRQDRELASIVDSQSKSSDTTFSSAGMTADSDDRSTDNMSNSSGQFRTDKKQDSGISVLTPQWKSASELTTPMSRLDDLLKANSLQHLRRTAKAAFQTSGSAAEETDRRAVSSTSVSSALPLHSKTSQSTGCLLASPALNDAQRQQQLATEARQRATTMTRCYLEKPPRATLPEKPPHRIARRAMTVQLDRRPVDRQTPSLSVAERQSTSQADLRHPQPPAGPSALDEESLDSGKSTNDNDVSKQSTDELLTSPASSTSSTSRRLRAADSSCQVPSQTEIDLQDLYEQKRLERQLEEKLARVERERADMIAKLWSQIDNRTATNTTATRQRTAAIVNDGLGDSSASSGLVLPLPHSTTSPSECNRQVKYTRVVNYTRKRSTCKLNSGQLLASNDIPTLFHNVH